MAPDMGAYCGFCARYTVTSWPIRSVVRPALTVSSSRPTSAGGFRHQAFPGCIRSSDLWKRPHCPALGERHRELAHHEHLGYSCDSCKVVPEAGIEPARVLPRGLAGAGRPPAAPCAEDPAAPSAHSRAAGLPARGGPSRTTRRRACQTRGVSSRHSSSMPARSFVDLRRVHAGIVGRRKSGRSSGRRSA